MSRTEMQPARVPEAKPLQPAIAADGGLFGLAFHNSPAMQSVVRASDGVLVEVNNTFLKNLGFTRDQVIGKTAFELNFWDEPERLGAYRQELESKGSVQGFEVRLRSLHGGLLTVLLSSHPVDIGGALHYLSAGVDITARKQAEAKLSESERQLRESEARFSTAFRACPVQMTIATLDDGRFVEVNDEFTRAIGLTREEAIGRNAVELGLWVHPEARVQFYEGVLKAGSLRNVDCQIRRRDGVVRTFQLSAEIVEIHRVPHLLTFAVDITQRKQAEAEQEMALQRERELSKLKSDFVSLVSHEFRTPLEIILSSADNLDRYHDRLPPEKRQQLLRTIGKSVRRMSGMMEEVLVLGRLEKERMTLKPVSFELRAFCQRMCDEIQSATGRRCPIQLQIEGAAEQAVGDEGVLRHIFSNLLSNAVKYSPVAQRVDFIVQRDGDDAVCRVVDRGCGIPAADQKGLFQAFHRGSNVREIPGTGLGLLIVQRCVELHGGEIQFESVEGRGTTFTVRLPLFEKPLRPAPEAARPQEALPEGT